MWASYSSKMSRNKMEKNQSSIVHHQQKVALVFWSLIVDTKDFKHDLQVHAPFGNRGISKESISSILLTSCGVWKEESTFPFLQKMKEWNNPLRALGKLSCVQWSSKAPWSPIRYGYILSHSTRWAQPHWPRYHITRSPRCRNMSLAK